MTLFSLQVPAIILVLNFLYKGKILKKYQTISENISKFIFDIAGNDFISNLDHLLCKDFIFLKTEFSKNFSNSFGKQTVRSQIKFKTVWLTETDIRSFDEFVAEVILCFTNKNDYEFFITDSAQELVKQKILKNKEKIVDLLFELYDSFFEETEACQKY